MAAFTTAALLTAAAVGTGMAIKQSRDQSKAMKNAAADADARAKAAAAELKGAEAAASSQAQESLNQRRRSQIAGSQSIYTSPLGIGGQADVARKTLLGM